MKYINILLNFIYSSAISKTTINAAAGNDIKGTYGRSAKTLVHILYVPSKDLSVTGSVKSIPLSLLESSLHPVTKNTSKILVKIKTFSLYSSVKKFLPL